MQTQIGQLLANSGYQIDLAGDGYEAVLKVRQNPPSLILLDAMLPKMSGFQVARLLKFDPKFEKIPIVMLTVLNQISDRERGKEVGVNLYLTKPFTDQELLSAIRRLLPS